MKKIISVVLLWALVFNSVSITAWAEEYGSTSEVQENESEEDSDFMEYMYKFTTGSSYKYLVTSSNFSYMKFVSEFQSNVAELYLIEMVDRFAKTGAAPDVNAYIEALANIITIYDRENAPSVAEQKKLDNLKNWRSYTGDVISIATDAASVYTGLYPSDSEIVDGLETAIDVLITEHDNINNWIDTLTNLETVLQDYSNYDSFLEIIEDNADGDLKEAASSMRNSMRKMLLVKLGAYAETEKENLENYTEFFYDKYFFNLARKSSYYTSDEAFKFEIDAGEKIFENEMILLDAWDLGVNIGKLAGNILVGGENLIKRVIEMEALYDISRILQENILTENNQFVIDYNQQKLHAKDVQNLEEMLRFLLATRQRGEYCIWNVVVKDGGMLSYFAYKSKEQANQWYQSQVNILANLRNAIPQNEGQKVETARLDNIILIAEMAKRLKYIGDKTYDLSAEWMQGEYGEYPGIVPVNMTGILAVAAIDFDQDGNNEILSVSYEPSSVISNENTIHLSVIKQEKNGWNVLTENEVVTQGQDGQYYNISCMDNTSSYQEESVFVRKYKESFEIYYENYGEGMFATGQNWIFRGFRFENNVLSPIAETQNITYEGSPITELWTSSYENLGQYDMTSVEMLKSYCSLGFERPYISFDEMTVDQNDLLYEILRTRLDTNISQDSVMTWVNSRSGGSLEGFYFKIKDTSKDIPAVLQESSADELNENESSSDISETENADINNKYLEFIEQYKGKEAFYSIQNIKEGGKPILLMVSSLENEENYEIIDDKNIYSKQCDVYDYVDGEIVQMGSIFSLSGYLSLYTKDTEDYIATRINTHSIYFTCIKDDKLYTYGYNMNDIVKDIVEYAKDGEYYDYAYGTTNYNDAIGEYSEVGEIVFEKISEDKTIANDEAESDENDAFIAYRNLIEKYEAEYGSASLNEQEQFWTGLCFAKLLDFNGDGVDELILAYQTEASNIDNVEYTVELWTFDGSSAERVTSQISWTGNNMPYFGGFSISKYEGKYLLVLTDNAGGDISYYGTKDDGSIGLVHELIWKGDIVQGDWYFDDEKISRETYEECYNKYRVDAIWYGFSEESCNETIKEEISQTRDTLKM